MLLRRTLLAALPLLLLLAIPILLKPEQPVAEPDKEAGKLVIVTPHTEPVRAEFAAAFEEHYRKTYHKDVRVEYRTIGGTSDIVRYIADRFEAEFRILWENSGKEWNAETASAFANPRSAQHPARKAFMASDTCIDIDIFWGGGVYDHSKQATKGFAVDGGVHKRHPEYLQEVALIKNFSNVVTNILIECLFQ